MSLTDSEVFELEELLHQREVDKLKSLLKNPEKANPNYRFLHESLVNQSFNENDELISGFTGCVLEGSSGAGKTWSWIDFIIWLCTEHETNCKINIYREFFAEFSDTLYDDFKRRLDDYDLPNPFHNAQIVKSFKIGNNRISFIGCDKIGKSHGGRCDYAFFNEGMFIPKETFDQVEQRCRKFWCIDYNPSFTDHWIFDNVIPRKDVGFLRTTFLDNPHISIQERRKILSYEPWEPGSYEIGESEVFYRGKPIDKNNQPPPHPTNDATANEFMHKVYGLGLRGAMEGLLFPKVTYIDEFPDIAFTYGLDFGFTADPTAMVKGAEDGGNIYLELLSYQPMETPEEIDAYFSEIGVSRITPITADSSDKHVSEKKGAVEMVKSLRGMGWEISKVRKTKNVMFWLNSMKNKQIHIVKSRLWKHAKKEQENYRLKEINGIRINQPIDEYNHFWDGARYNHMAHNSRKFELGFG